MDLITTARWLAPQYHATFNKRYGTSVFVKSDPKQKPFNAYLRMYYDSI